MAFNCRGYWGISNMVEAILRGDSETIEENSMDSYRARDRLLELREE